MSQLTTTNNQLATSEDANAIQDFRDKLQNFTMLLNKAPQKEKIQTHEGYQYLPISVVEKELDKLFFGLVQYECLSYNQIFNEIACHARIKVFHPVIQQWINYDGLGSAVIQQDKDTKVSDFGIFKKQNALQLALPKAYAEAIKNAAKKIGKRFGADINRKFEDIYEPMVAKSVQPVAEAKKDVEAERIRKMLKDYPTVSELMKVKSKIPTEYQSLFTERFAELGGQR